MPSFFAELRQLPRTYWVLVGATFVNRFGLFVWPFLTLFITRQGNSAAQAGYAVMSYSIGSLLAAFTGGWLTDRVGRNVTLATSSFGSAICMMALSQGQDWRSLAVIAFFTGWVTEAAAPAHSALLQDIVEAELRPTAFLIQRWAINLGWATGPAVAGFLAKSSFFWLFVVDASTSAFFGVIALLYLPTGLRTEASQASWATAWPSIRANRPLLMLALTHLCMVWVFRQTSSTFTLHSEASGLSTEWLGTVLALNGVMICVLEIPLLTLTKHWPVRPMLGAGYLVMGCSYLWLLGQSELWEFFACVILFTIGEMLAFSRQQAYSASLSPEDMRGRYAGFLNLAWGVGGIITSGNALRIYESSPNTIWWSCGAMGLLACVLINWPVKQELNEHRGRV
jgi:MFS family permease